MKNTNEKPVNDKLLKDAQYRKGLSIAFFNASNCATELVKAEGEITKEKFVEWRDWLLTEHARYYAETIAKVGVAYNREATILKLNAVNSYEELREVWTKLSEDERRDVEIVKVKQQLKEKYFQEEHYEKI